MNIRHWIMKKLKLQPADGRFSYGFTWRTRLFPLDIQLEGDNWYVRVNSHRGGNVEVRKDGEVVLSVSNHAGEEWRAKHEIQ